MSRELYEWFPLGGDPEKSPEESEEGNDGAHTRS